MALNRQIADLLERAAQLVELTGGNRFRVAAYQRGARVLRDLNEDVEQLADDPKKLTAIDGIGQGLAEKIIEYAETGHIAEIDQLAEKVPPGVVDVMAVPGVGPRTAAVMWKQGQVHSLETLKAALEDGRIEKLPRMGAKTVANLRKSLAFMASAGQRKRLGEALPMACYFVDQLARLKAVRRIDYAGSLRRGCETIGDIDILIAADATDADAVSRNFREMSVVEQVLVAGPAKSSVRVTGAMQVDLRVVRPDRYGAALAYFTGSTEHNVALRQRAIDRQMRLNEYGLWHADDIDRMDEADPVAAETEQAIYQALELPFIDPALREHRGEIAAAQRGELSQLIQQADIRCELHAHTSASDGRLSIEELIHEAIDRRFHTIAVTDHSRSQAQANGLDVDRLAEQIDQVHQLARKHNDIQVLAGIEVDILSDGKLDLPNSILKQLDIVVASPHAALRQDSAKATARLLRAIDNPYVDIIGHPTGRLIGKREGLSPDIRKLIAGAIKTGTALELNANPWRLDLRDTHLKAAVEAGAWIAINTDAHGVSDFDLLRYGIMTARRGWVTADRVITCLDADGLKTWLKDRRRRAGVG